MNAAGRINQPIVLLRGLKKSFAEGSSQRLVLDDLDFDFMAGKFTAILGKSGSGKSTLLNLISGIERPSDGEIIVSGLSINQLKDKERTLFRRDNIGFIFQFFNLIPTLTVLENITLPQDLAGIQAAQGRSSARRYLEAVGLADRESQFPDKLSGGEQQRVAIARALAHNPVLILADEPTGNLDEETGEIVLALLLELTRTAERTLIMATHNTDIASAADQVLSLVDGKLVAGS